MPNLQTGERFFSLPKMGRKIMLALAFGTKKGRSSVESGAAFSPHANYYWITTFSALISKSPPVTIWPLLDDFVFISHLLHPASVTQVAFRLLPCSVNDTLHDVPPILQSHQMVIVLPFRAVLGLSKETNQYFKVSPSILTSPLPSPPEKVEVEISASGAIT